ncbi:TetR/AcrR family transcriptional regulator [Mycobacterium avium subsp. paratuberculosis]|uniref:HTH tetR-type domain-containing protein n=3 Tax=Mycobacterium avium TaxID=1764 RepID=Q73Z82_MYCPA|nr:TetR/AcrR family transcriptional regulator [Mycobacterium avium]ETA97351.1 TetR family transcriptional regulator [Mycobacterium avium 10-5581]ETB11746.1 TetR family transcriptional regulator [Mycobacterium avium subsp. paratuberculosis 08-8281]ETB32164.1 TetR family transcriptional regulator [Mycobacterium avium subsp. paratuberculosis 10-5975]ETB51614.1 TetR family transcriptional regulator [Mycobacterium avium subsp. paratuberculosis 10-8425]QPM71709.1 TetR/AcrR family transcriptional reg
MFGHSSKGVRPSWRREKPLPRISREQKERNRGRILAAAGEGFKARGIDGVGIDELMKAAGMSHGGFYNHFPSKEDLALEVLHQGFTDSLDTVAAVIDTHAHSGRAALHAIIDTYLSTEHRDHPEHGCASAALAADAGRHGVKAQEAYRRGLQGYIGAFADLLRVSARQRGTKLDARRAREQAIGLFSQMVGAQLIARAVAHADPGLSDEILSSNSKALKRLRM